jgi:hypothetical protein
MIRTELEDIVALCRGTANSEESPYITIGRIQSMAERALKI